MQAIEATEISTVNGYKLHPRVLREELTGITVTLRHLPMRVYLHITAEAKQKYPRQEGAVGSYGQICHEAIQYAAFSIKSIEGLDEPPTWSDYEIDGQKYPRLNDRVLDTLPPGFLQMLRGQIMEYNLLTVEEQKKLNFSIA